MHRCLSLFLCAFALHAHIDELIPAQTTAGAATFTLRVLGQDFIAEEYMQWNGTRLETSFISESELRATVPAALIRSSGTYVVSLAGSGGGGVTYPGGGGSSGPAGANITTRNFAVNPPLAITSVSPLQNAAPGAAYLQPLFRTGGTAPFDWTVSAGSLPAGLALDRATGILRGAAPAAGSTSTFTVRLADAPGTFTTRQFTLTVGAGGTAAPQLSCVFSPQNTMIAVHHPDNHRAGRQLYPDHTMRVVLTGASGPVASTPVTLTATRPIFPDASGLPGQAAVTSSTNAEGSIEFRFNPPAAFASDRTDVTATARSGTATATCSGTIVVGAGTLTAISQSLAAATMAKLDRDDFGKDLRRFSDEFRELVAGNPALELKAIEAYERFEPVMQTILNGGQVQLQGPEVAGLIKLLRGFEKQASPELKRALHRWAAGVRALDGKIEYEKRIDWRDAWKSAAALGAPSKGAPSIKRGLLSFEPNQGQTDAGVQFLARGSSRGALFTADGVTMQNAQGGPLRMRLAGRKTWPKPEALELLATRSHYLGGRDAANWRTGVPHYARLRYANIYPGADLVFYGDGAQLRYDFILAPGAKPGMIGLHFDGAADLEAQPSGDLQLHHRGGATRLGKPFAYQDRDGKRVEIASRYIGRGKDGIGFELGDYDPALPLVIDPIVSYSTFIGGNGEDAALAVAVDSQGSSYIAGLMSSPNAPGAKPVQTGAAAPSAGNLEAFVTKFTPDGSGVVYTTYFGGAGADFAAGIAVDAAGNAYVCGSTLSTNFPIVGGVQSTYGGGTMATGGDGFVVKLNAAGSAIVYSTYLGGSAADVAKSIAVDATGNTYVTGFSASANFPTRNPIQPGLRGGLVSKSDAFVTKLNPAGGAILYSTLLGGRGDDLGMGIAVDAAGAALVTGVTYSTDFPVQNALQPANAGFADAFLAKLDPAGSALAYATYFGGENDDFGLAIALDGSANAYLAGSTGSTRFPVQGAAQTKLGGESALGFDAFVSKIAASGASIIYSTYLGGNGIDLAQGIAVAADGSAFVAGETDSPDFPTSNAVRAPGGRNDGFLTKLAPSGATIEHSTYLGGDNLDSAAGVALDRGGNAYIAGSSSSRDYPVTAGSSQALLGGRTDAFALKVGVGATRPALRTQPAASRTPSGGIAPDSIVSVFGPSLATRTEVSPSSALPSSLSGVTVTLRDSRGAVHPASLFFVSPSQINFLAPAAAAPGFASVSVSDGGQIAAEGTVRIDPVAPALFSANSAGAGAPAGFAIRAGGANESLFACGATAATCQPAPISLGGDDRVYLLLFGTGIRGRTALGAVTLSLGGVNVPIAYAGAQGEFPGFDQINAGPLPRELAGRGEVDLILAVDGERANTLKVRIQ